MTVSTPRSHPDALTLQLFSVGGLGPAFRAAVAAHAADCLRCGARLREDAALCGAILAEELPVPLAPGALEAVLARLDEPVRPSVRLSALLTRHGWPVAPGVRHAGLPRDWGSGGYRH